MKQTPKTGPEKTPSVVGALPGFGGCDLPKVDPVCRVLGDGAAAGACARGRLGAVPLGNTGTTTVEGCYPRSYVKRDVLGSWSRVEVSL